MVVPVARVVQEFVSKMSVAQFSAPGKSVAITVVVVHVVSVELAESAMMLGVANTQMSGVSPGFTCLEVPTPWDVRQEIPVAQIGKNHAIMLPFPPS